MVAQRGNELFIPATTLYLKAEKRQSGIKGEMEKPYKDVVG